MKKMKIIALLIVIVQLFSLSSCDLVMKFVDSAASFIDGKKAEYKLSSDGTYAILISSANSKEVEIDSTYEGVPVKYIVSSAFIGCDKIKTIKIPSSIVYVSASVSRYLTSLESIIVDDENPIYYSEGNCLIQRDTSTVNQEYLFEPNTLIPTGDAWYTTQEYPKGVTLIWGCQNSIIPDGVQIIGDSAFAGSSIKNIAIPVGVTSIGSSAFENCALLTNITIPDTVKTIGTGAFANCTSLSSINLPEGITTIDARTFFGCSALTGITIPDSVTSINLFAFSGCTNLYRKENGITYVDRWVMYGDNDLQYVVLLENTVGIGPDAFSGALQSITIPKGLKGCCGDAFFYCNNLSDVYAADLEGWLNISFSTDVGSRGWYSHPNHCRDAQLHILDETGKEMIDITIPDSVNCIRDSAFFNCKKMESITISNSVTSVGEYAFYNCENLKSITIPNSVTSIGQSAFYNCKKLTSVTMLGGVTTIGLDAFSDCDNLKSVTIPRSVTNIASGAFSSCDELKDIFFDGTIAEWELIEKGGMWDTWSGFYTIHCTDGEIAKNGTVTYY